MKWQNVAFVIPNSNTIEFDDSGSYKLIGDEKIANQLLPELHKFTSENIIQWDQLFFPQYSGSTYLVPISGLTTILFFDEGIKLILLHDIDINYDPSWMVHLIMHLKRERKEVSIDSIVDSRFDYLFYTSLRSQFQIGRQYDLFPTIPSTSFSSQYLNKSVSSIGQVITQLKRNTTEEIISSIEKLFSCLSMSKETNNEAICEVIIEFSNSLDDFGSTLEKELVLIKINILTSLFHAKLPTSSHELINQYAIKVQQLAISYELNSAQWIISAFQTWYLKTADPVREINWDTPDIPHQVRLLPILTNIEHNSLLTTQSIQELVELNFKILADPLPYFGLEEFQEQLGKIHLEINDYANAETYFEYAAELYQKKNNFEKEKKARYSALYAELEYYRELAIAANLFHYTGRLIESSTMGWSALTSALNVVKELLELGVNDSEMTNKIMQYYGRCRRPLLSDMSNEMTPVIELKLDELYNFIKNVHEGIILGAEALQMTEMHIDSLRFLKPAKPPRFMLMTSDGRLIDTQEAVAIPEDVSDSTLNHLIAGALTAIRSILQEATQSSGVVKEINAGDSVLLMEAKTDFVIVASATNVSENLRRMVVELADEIHEKHGEIIKNWYGDSESMSPIRDLIRHKIVEELL